LDESVALILSINKNDKDFPDVAGVLIADVENKAKTTPIYPN